MSDLNSALRNLHSHLNNFNAYSRLDAAAADLHEDNLMLKGMQAHEIDLKTLQLAANISIQAKNLQIAMSRPSLGAQQMVAKKIDSELREIRHRIRDILKIPPKHDKKVEQPHQTKA